MTVRFHRHALERLSERGATELEVVATVEAGEKFPAKFGRVGFRRDFPFNGKWRGCFFSMKQIEAYAVAEENDWLVITVIVKYFEQGREAK